MRHVEEMLEQAAKMGRVEGQLTLLTEIYQLALNPDFTLKGLIEFGRERTKDLREEAGV